MRSVAIAFLIALIISYSVQVTGQLASEQDYATRQIHYKVGVDIAVHVVNASEAHSIASSIAANVSETKSTTIEYLVYLRQAGGMTLKAIEPRPWLETAYYEKELFSGTSLEKMFNDLDSNNNSIILERRIAKCMHACHYLVKVNRELGKTIIMVTHDPSVTRVADRILRIEGGVIKMVLTPSEVIAEEKAVPYIDQLRARIGEINVQLQQLDEYFNTGKISGDEYVEKRQSLKQTKDSLKEELSRMGVVT